MSQATGQNALSFFLTNRGAKACVLNGYPAVAFLDASGRRLPFRVSHKGDQRVTSDLPSLVRVLPSRSAAFALNKYRCDRRTRKVATKLRMGLPGARTSARLPLAIPLYLWYWYCGKNDPGSVVAVSPIVPTVAAAFER